MRVWVLFEETSTASEFVDLFATAELARSAAIKEAAECGLVESFTEGAGDTHHGLYHFIRAWDVIGGDQ